MDSILMFWNEMSVNPLLFKRRAVCYRSLVLSSLN